MMYSSKRKFYVVWEGRAPGVYDSWEECEAQVKGFPGARYKAFGSQADAVAAFRGNGSDDLEIFRQIGAHKCDIVNYSAFPEIRLDAIAVDGACAKNPGPMEYRGVKVSTGEEIFHIGPLEGGTNNIGEYIALIHAASLLARNGDYTTPIYSDSKTALAWVRRGRSNTSVQPNSKNAKVIELLRRADAWLAGNRIVNPILKWNTELWGEIPADFGRK